jgi:high-affinity iron transporter
MGSIFSSASRSLIPMSLDFIRDFTIHFTIDLTTALPVFLITLREGVEAALIVGIVLACLAKANATHLNRAAYQGLGAGVGLSLLLGAIVTVGLQTLGLSTWIYAAAVKQALQGGIAIVAIGLLSWMLIWMTQQAKGLKAAVETSVQSAIGGNSSVSAPQAQTAWGIFSLIFIAVLREGVETVLFIGTQVQQGWMPLLGAIAGLVGATAIGLLIFKGGRRLNLRLFFQIMGTLLLLIVAGLVVTALRKAEVSLGLLAQIDPQWQRFCWGETASCLLGGTVWDLSDRLPDSKFPGLVIKALFGYTQHLYLLQAIAYLTFLSLIGGRYWKSLNS